MIKRLNSYMLLILTALMMLSACRSIVPATVPLQLEHTPGAPITITYTRIDGGWFTLEYPDGWRVITNVALEPLGLVLVSADDAIIITVSETATTADPTPTTRHVSLQDNGRILTVSGEIPENLAVQFDEAFNDIVESVTFR